MLDAIVKEPSPEARRFITTAAKIPADSGDFAKAVSWVAQAPVVPSLGQRLIRKLLNLEWQQFSALLGWPISNAEQDNAEQDLEEKRGLEHWQVLRLEMIRAFEHEQNAKRKRRLAETLKRFEMEFPPSKIIPMPT